MRRLNYGNPMAATLALALGLSGCDDGGVSGVTPGDGGEPDGHVGIDPTPDEDSGTTPGDDVDSGTTMDSGAGDGDVGDGDGGDGDTVDAGGDGDEPFDAGVIVTTRIEAEDFDEGLGVMVEPCNEGTENVMDVGNGEWLAFYNFTFTGVTGFKVRAASERHPAQFEFRKNSETGPLVAVCEPPFTAGWQDWTTVTCDADPSVTGTGTLYVVFRGADDEGAFLPNINWIDIVQDDGQVVPAHIEAEDFYGDLNIGIEDCADSAGGRNLMNVGNGEWTAYDNFSFHGINGFDVRVASNNFPSKIHFRKGSPTGPTIATCDAPFTGGWQNWQTVSCAGTAESGTGALYVVYEGANEDEQLPNVNWFESKAIPVEEDAGVELDSGTGELDSGTGELDSGTPVEDAGTPLVDAGSEEPDAGPPAPTPFVGYHFDETTGTSAADFTGGGNAVTTTGAVSWVAGKSGNALHLDGTDAFASLPAGIMVGVTDFTIATWVNLDQVDTWSRIWDFGNDQQNYLLLTPRNGDTGRMRFEIKVNNNNQWVDAGDALPFGSWQHVAVVHEGSKLSIYLNGVLVGFKPNISNTPDALGSTANNWIGKSEYSSDALMKGSVDDLAIYDEALSDAEVQALAGVTVATPAPAALLFGYHFDETTGTNASDYSGHGMNGTLVGASSFVAGRFNNAVNLDNANGDKNLVDAQVNMPNGAISTLHDYSMSIWAKPTTNFDWAQLIDFGTDNNHYLAVIPRTGDGAHTLRFTLKNGGGEQTVDAPNPLAEGAWTHVAITSTGNTVLLYVNGELAGMNAGVTIDPADMGNTTRNALGFSQWEDHRFNGQIDEFDVYDGVLLPDDVKDLASRAPTP